MAAKSRGTKIQVDPGGGFVLIPGARDITYPSPTVEEIDVTDQDSPSNSKEFLAGDVDYGTVTFTVNWEYANARHIALIADQAAGTARSYRVLHNASSGTAHATEFTAYVSGITRQAPVSGVYSMDVSLRVTGQPTEDTSP